VGELNSALLEEQLRMKAASTKPVPSMRAGWSSTGAHLLPPSCGCPRVNVGPDSFCSDCCDAWELLTSAVLRFLDNTSDDAVSESLLCSSPCIFFFFCHSVFNFWLTFLGSMDLFLSSTCSRTLRPLDR